MSIASLVVTAALLCPSAPADPAPAAPAELRSDPPPAKNIAGPGPNDDARKLAESYLNALSGKGKEEARNFLLGGVTLTAQDFKIPNWKIASRDEARVEELSLYGAAKAMWVVDKVGTDSLKMVSVTEGEQLKLSQDDAKKILVPTRAAAAKFQTDFPLFSYVARVDKDVFWHPDNPWRNEVKKLGHDKEAKYRLEVHRFFIEEKEKGKVSRTWPLRVLRVKTPKYDSGWKVLPASDWDPAY